MTTEAAEAARGGEIDAFRILPSKRILAEEVGVGVVCCLVPCSSHTTEAWPYECSRADPDDCFGELLVESDELGRMESKLLIVLCCG